MSVFVLSSPHSMTGCPVTPKVPVTLVFMALAPLSHVTKILFFASRRPGVKAGHGLVCRPGQKMKLSPDVGRQEFHWKSVAQFVKLN